MTVVLQNNLILIRTNFRTLNQSWMREFLTLHSQNMLFLPKAVLIFKDQSLCEGRKQFLDTLSNFYAEINDFCQIFYKKSLLKLSNTPIKIELVSMQEIQHVSVELYARDRYTIDISLFYPNSWVMSYLKSQLGMHIKASTESSLVVDVSHPKAKKRLQRALGRRHVLHYEIQYRYDSKFMERLYGGFSIFDNGVHEDESIVKMMSFYNILGCPVGASKDLIKQNYKKLARVYHPDRIYHQSSNMLGHYTQKFQMIQEAYSALRVVS